MRHASFALLLIVSAGLPVGADESIQRGRLVGPDGQALPDREVRIYTWSDERVAVGRTDAEGRFAVDVAPLGSEYYVRLVVGTTPKGAANQAFYLGGTPFADKPPAPHDWGTLHVPRLPVLVGRVVDARGVPLAHTRMSVVFPSETETVTDADGRFELQMFVGRHKLFFEAVDRDPPALHLIEGQGRVSLEIVLNSTPLAQLVDDDGSHGSIRLQRIAGDPAWGLPWEQANPSWTAQALGDVSQVVPGEYRVIELEGSAFMGPPTHPVRSWTVTLRAGENRLEPPPDAALAVPLRLQLDGVPETDDTASSLRGWSHPLEPPPLEESAFRLWPIHEMADADNWRYHGRLLALTAPPEPDDEAEPPEDEDDEDDEAPPSERPSQNTLIAHLLGPGTWGLTLTAARTHMMIPVKVDQRPGPVRSRWAPAKQATVSLVRPALETFVYPATAMNALHAVLLDEAGVVCWARPFDFDVLPLDVQVAPGRYRLRWGYDGFQPRETALELRGSETATVPLDPF